MKFYMNGEENKLLSENMNGAAEDLRLMQESLQKMKGLYVLALANCSGDPRLPHMKEAIDEMEKRISENQTLGKEVMEMILSMGYTIST